MVRSADCASRSCSRRARAAIAFAASQLCALYAVGAEAQPIAPAPGQTAPPAQVTPQQDAPISGEAPSAPGGQPARERPGAADLGRPAEATAARARGSVAQPPAPARPVSEAIALEPGRTCLEHDLLARRVARWLRREHVDARIRVLVRGSEREPDAVSFAIAFEGGRPTERNIHGAPADCDQFHSALALSVALAIDAALLDAQRAQPADDDVPSDEELLALQPEEPGYFRLALGAFAHATSGLLTDVAPAGSARIEVGLARWLDLRAGALASWVDEQRLPGVQGRFDVRLIAGRLDGCGVLALRQLRLLACAGAMGGSFRTQGRDFPSRVITDHEPWWAVVGSVELQAEISTWLTLAVTIDLAVPLLERWIGVRDADNQPLPAADRKLTAVGVLAGAGPVFRFF